MGGSIFEAGMLFFFGAAWPVSIFKALRSRSAKGKSGFFSFVVATGYVFGITHKLLYSRDIVLALYFINITMITIDIALWFRNKRLDAAADKTGDKRDDNKGDLTKEYKRDLTKEYKRDLTEEYKRDLTGEYKRD